MRVISHILRFVGYVTLIPYLASCMLWIPNLFEVLYPVVTLIFILGYGDSIRSKEPWNSPLTFWAANVIFYVVSASLAISTNYGVILPDIKALLSDFRDAFIPAYQPDVAPNAVGRLTFVTFTGWMPVAGSLSVIALAVTLRQRRSRSLTAT